MSTRLLLAGISTRAAADSAARAGFSVTAIDGFGDLDQHPDVDAHALPGGFDPQIAVRVASRLACDAVSYLSSFENHPAAVSELSAGRALWGNAPAALRRVRDPYVLAGALSRRGLPGPVVARDPSVRSPEHSRPGQAPATGDSGNGTRNSTSRWLAKPRASGGGHGIRPWRPGRRLPRDYYLQEHVEGVSASIAFAANGRESAVLGMSRQLAGLADFGATGFQYCGNVLDPALNTSPVLRDAAAQLAQVLTEEFELVGVNGVDVIVKDGMPFAIEVNPRWSASMELIEQALGTSVFAMHANACVDHQLPHPSLFSNAGALVRGKAIVYARSDVSAGNTTRWLTNPQVRDIPREGVRLAAGQPVCTVFAEDDDVAGCLAALQRMAGQIHAELLAWQGAMA